VRLLVRHVLASSAPSLRVVEEAIDGPDALEVVERLDPPPVPTVIILDNQMPGLSGLDVAAAVLRRAPHQRIVLFSSFVTSDIEREARRIGVTACLSKSRLSELPDLVLQVAEGEDVEPGH
jgi:DNA-binding NarL/FixJ family response regulator